MSPVLRLAVTYLALLALLAITVSTSFVPLGFGNTAIGLLVAAAKSGLVLVVFMELGRGSPLLRLVAATAGLWLVLLFGLSWIGLRGV